MHLGHTSSTGECHLIRLTSIRPGTLLLLKNGSVDARYLIPPCTQRFLPWSFGLALALEFQNY
ncbi:hypothetical protein RP20_CCG008586 [Aedes albopictus]|nr:hypothetical protein RP20_CCG008586 [Aedes albopictus]